MGRNAKDHEWLLQCLPRLGYAHKPHSSQLDPFGGKGEDLRGFAFNGHSDGCDRTEKELPNSLAKR